jgi:hypothetical protein
MSQTTTHLGGVVRGVGGRGGGGLARGLRGGRAGRLQEEPQGSSVRLQCLIRAQYDKSQMDGRASMSLHPRHGPLKHHEAWDQAVQGPNRNSSTLTCVGSSVGPVVGTWRGKTGVSGRGQASRHKAGRHVRLVAGSAVCRAWAPGWASRWGSADTDITIISIIHRQ